MSATQQEHAISMGITNRYSRGSMASVAQEVIKYFPVASHSTRIRMAS
jgi:hypothetical protein